MPAHFENLIEEANALFEEKAYEACLEFLEQNQLIPPPPGLSTVSKEQIHFLAADSLFFQEDYEEAVPHYQESIQLLKTLPEEKAKMWQRLTDLGYTYSWLDKLEESRNWHEQAFQFARQAFGPDSEETIKSQKLVADCCYKLEDYQEAEKEYRSLLEFAEPHFKEGGERFWGYYASDYYLSLANTLYSEEKDEEALGYYKKALEYIPLDDEGYLPCLQRIMELQQLLGKEDSLIKDQVLLAEAMEQEGEASEELAETAERLRNHFWNLKDYPKAIAYAKLANQYYQEVLGEQAPKSLDTAQEYIVTLDNAGQLSTALQINKQLDTTYKQMGDEAGRILTLYQEGLICYKLDKYNKAEKAFQKALKISKQQKGALADQSARIMHQLARVYYWQNREELAVSFLKPYLEKYQNSEQPDPLLVAKMQRTLGDACNYVPGRSQEAIQFYEEALAYYQQQNQESTQTALTISFKIANIQYKKLENYGEAIARFVPWLEAAEGVLAEDDWRMRTARLQLAMSYYRLDGFVESEEVAGQLLAIFRRTEQQRELSEKEQITKLDTLHLLGIISLKTKRIEQVKVYAEEAEIICQAYCEPDEKRASTQETLMIYAGGSGQVKEKTYSQEKQQYFDFIREELDQRLGKRRVRVFISSTFRDMMDEREHLIKNIFPRLKSKCREVGIDFSEVDLRWGVTEEDVEQGRVIEICLDEIDRSRPYFIGLLGERYGWVPTLDSFANFERVLHNYAWLKEDFEQGLSITEMEMQYGVLRNPAMKGYAFFYLRDKKLTPGEAFKEEKQSDAYTKLKQLKSSLREQEDYPVRDYASIEQLGEMIYEDLLERIFDEEELEIQEDSPEQHMRDQLEYLNLLKDFYVPVPNLQKRFEKALHTTNRLVLTGPEGSGKTAFLANWIAELSQSPEAGLPAFYFPDGSAGSKDFGAVLAELVAQIRMVYGGLPDFNPRHTDPAHALAEVLKAIPEGEQIYLILDGIEQLKQSAFFGPLYWIPAELPDHIKLVFSTHDERLEKILKEKGFSGVPAKPLPKALQTSFIKEYLLKFGKKLPAEIVKTIASHSLAKNPLSLKVLLDELRIFGKHEELRPYLDFYLEANDTTALFEKLLTRLEQDYEASAPGVIRNILLHLIASHKGLAEEELIELCNTAQLFWSPIYSALENYILRNRGLLSIQNISLQTAIRKRYLSREDELKTVHSHLADYFAQAPEQRQHQEYPWQLWQADRLEELKDFLLQIPVLLHFYQHAPDKFFAYFEALNKRYDLIAGLQQTVEQYEQDENKPRELSEGLTKIITLLSYYASPEQLSWFKEKQAALAGQDNKDRSELDRVERLMKQGELAISNLQHEEALRAFEEALKILERNPGYRLVYKRNALMGIATVYQQQERWDESYQKAEEALAYSREKLGENNLTIPTIYDHLAKVEFKRGNQQEAMQLLKEGLDMAYAYAGKEHMLVATLLSTQAFFTQEMASSPEEAYQKALPLFEKAYDIQLNEFGAEGLATIVSGAAISRIAAEAAQTEAHRDFILSNFEHCKKTFGPEHPMYRKMLEYRVIADSGHVLKAWEEEKYDDAILTSLQTFYLGKEGLGLDHQLVQKNLGFLLRATKMFELEDEDWVKELEQYS